MGLRRWCICRRLQIHQHRIAGFAVCKRIAPFSKTLTNSPDGSHLATGGRDGIVRVGDLTGNGEPQLLKGHSSSVHALAYSPDGSRLASAGRDGTVLIWDAARGVELCLLRGDGERVGCLRFSPDGTLLAWAGGGHGVHIADARPWTPANGIDHEGRGSVAGLFARPLLKADVVRYRDAPPALCRKALAWAETACDLAPDSGACLTTRGGIARCWLGQYTEAPFRTA